MPIDADDIKLRLVEMHEEFRQLTAQHQDLDQRLSGLSSKSYLSEPEQLEETTLKKKKLQVKDRMEDILRHHRGLLGAPTPAPSPMGSVARS